MAPDVPHIAGTTLPGRQILIDQITELFRKAGKIDTTMCVKDLFTKDAEDLAKEAYCFVPANHDEEDLDRQSFKAFQQRWATEYGKSGKGDGRFPEVRKKTAQGAFSKCTLKCMCSTCSGSKAEELQCDTCDFGDNHMVLIHQFPYEDGQTWAVILGTRDDPDEYYIWGKIADDGNTRTTSYHDKIVLKEATRAMNTDGDNEYLPGPEYSKNGAIIGAERDQSKRGRVSITATGTETPSKKRKAGRGKINMNMTFGDEEFVPDEEFDEQRLKARTVSGSSKRRRTTDRRASAEESASKSSERNGKPALHTPASDDEENLKLSQLSVSRRRAAAGTSDDDGSSATPVPAKVSRLQQATSDIQQPREHSLYRMFIDVRAHLNSQMDSDGLPVICSNAKLERYLQGLEAAVDNNKAYAIGSMRDMIDEELRDVGLPALPKFETQLVG